jgi:4-hydroxybenzoate polyprenyltransferase
LEEARAAADVGVGGTPRSGRARLRVYLRFVRPFTLLPPWLGAVSGAVTAWGSAANPQVLAGEPRRWTASLLATVALGSLCAALLNAASNAINQIYDVENDRVNKPERPLVTGELGVGQAWRLAAALYVLAIAPTWLVLSGPASGLLERLRAPWSAHECFFLFLAGALFTFVYSAPALGRTKANAFLSNLTIAIPRGLLLKVAGWSLVASVAHLEPWFIGAIFFLFLVGASSTKDFSDLKGDEAAGCRTLPIRFGVRRAAEIISPFFVVPWVLLPVGAWTRNPWEPDRTILTGNPYLLTLLGSMLALWGAHTVRLLLRNPDDLARTENHPSWSHMYWMMMTAQIGFAVAYLF